MRKIYPKLNNFVCKHRAGLIVCAVLLAIVLFFAGRVYVERPRDLGSRLHYVGKVSSGCLIPVCDSTPGTTYYFATDMSLKETMGYFRKTKCALPENVVIEVDCGVGESSFNFWYYPNDPEEMKYYGDGVRDLLKSSKKRLLISIERDEYANAKAAL